MDEIREVRSMPNDERVARGKKRKVRRDDLDDLDDVLDDKDRDDEANEESKKRRKKIGGKGGERRALSIHRFLSYKFSDDYDVKVNEKEVRYLCKDRTVGELMWEFATRGDLTGALGKSGTAKGGGTVYAKEGIHGCLVDKRMADEGLSTAGYSQPPATSTGHGGSGR